MVRSPRKAPRPRAVARRTLAALAATGLAGLGLALTVAPTATSAVEPEFVAQEQQYYEGTTNFGDLGSCGPRNLNGRGEGNSATWKVQSTLAPGTEVEPGDTWLVRAEITALTANKGNNGPDPLRLKLHYTGPAEVIETVGVSDPGPGEVLHGGDGSYGSVGQVSATEWEFDANSNPGVFELGDGAYVRMDVTFRATAEGVVNLDRMQVSGYDGTPPAGNFSCPFPVDWDFPVDDVDPPTSGADSARTDASYDSDTIDDANGGAHGIQIPVLANDDDPEVAGGPGSAAEVRIKDWQPGSVLGGTVSCGTPQQKGVATFGAMSTGPCTYTPPQDTTLGQNDSFGYVLRSVSGLERFVKVNVDLADNTAPAGGDQEVGVGPNAAVQFQLSPTDAQGDPVTCIADPVLAVAPNGNAGIDANCLVTWSANAVPGAKTFTYRACDQHGLLQNGDLGQVGASFVTRAAGYAQGSPSDLDPDLSSRCADFDVTVNVQSGLQLPPNGGSDSDSVDSGYLTGGQGGSAIGAYTVEIPVLANDTDGNGVQPSDPAWNGSIGIISGPTPGSGTATVNAADEVVFTPADGYEGLVALSYRVCEDPAQQDPVYVDDPGTPAINEGLPLCGVGKVSILVVGNDAPTAEPDAVLVASDDTVTDLDVSGNDADPEGQTLECTPGPLVATPADLVASASIDAQCLVDLTPVAGASGAADLTYELCDVHALLDPANPASPYGADGRQPGDLANRCTSGVLTATIVAPAGPQPDPDNPDPDPTCTADVATTTSGEAVAIAVLDNDSDTDLGGDPSELGLGAAGIDGEEEVTEAGGSLVVDGDLVTYTPPPGFVGTDSFLYSAVDSEGQGCSADVEVEVAAATVDPTTPTPSDPTTPVDPSGNGGSGNGSGGGDGVLPRTGSDGVAPQVAVALALLAVGCGVVAVARTTRLRRTRS